MENTDQTKDDRIATLEKENSELKSQLAKETQARKEVEGKLQMMQAAMNKNMFS